jgi:hypothetical protein
VPLTFSISATDPDGDSITYSRPDCPAGRVSPNGRSVGPLHMPRRGPTRSRSSPMTVRVRTRKRSPSAWATSIGLPHSIKSGTAPSMRTRSDVFRFRERSGWRCHQLLGHRSALRSELRGRQLQLDAFVISGRLP